MELFIKNMVCPRCILAVEQILKKHEIDFTSVELGLAKIEKQVSPEKLEQISLELKELGFELLNPGKAALISKIKTLIVEQVHYQDEGLKVNLSSYLSDKLNYEYSYLSRLFSSVEGITIEKYSTKQRVEKIKELIRYDELSLSQIADQLSYSSVSHLSSQFKKETGMTPTQFKAQSGGRTPISNISSK